MVDVWRPEEKGSDVNLAAYLVRDAFKNEADLHVVVSNDSDLEEAIRIVTTDVGRTVWLIFPHGIESKDLLKCRHERVVWISSGKLRKRQPPNPVWLGKTKLVKPVEWL